MGKHKVPSLSGSWAEGIAAEYLVEKGYVVVERNWRKSYFEIDIICQYQDILVFVEVKSRSNLAWGMPFHGLNHRKQQSMLAGATLYMESMYYEDAIRFDLIEVVAPENMNPRIRHFEDVFFPQ